MKRFIGMLAASTLLVVLVAGLVDAQKKSVERTLPNGDKVIEHTLIFRNDGMNTVLSDTLVGDAKSDTTLGIPAFGADGVQLFIALKNIDANTADTARVFFAVSDTPNARWTTLSSAADSLVSTAAEDAVQYYSLDLFADGITSSPVRWNMGRAGAKTDIRNAPYFYVVFTSDTDAAATDAMEVSGKAFILYRKK